MKAVSVIIPIYQVQDYIEDCLLSVLHQTLTDIEIICVDDGSPDDSMKIVERYAKEDDRLVMIRKENGGLSSARNAGMDAATGEYIYFMDSDDLLHESALQYLYLECRQHDLDSIFFDADSFYERPELEKKFPHFRDFYHRPNHYEEVVTGQELFVAMRRTKDWRSSACLQMNRRSMLQDCGVRFYEGIIHEDQLFTTQLSFYSRRAKHIALPFYLRRVRDASIMSSRRAKASADGYFRTIQELLKLLPQHTADRETLDVYLMHLNKLQKNAAEALLSIPREEAARISFDGTAQERMEYEQWIRHFTDYCRDRSASAEQLLSEQRALRASATFRLGKALTFVPGKLKHFAEAHREPDVKISIVMPVYNGAEYLQPCLDSLRSQTLTEIEILCVEDASSDASPAILQENAAKDSRIRIFSQPHLGAGSARNLGIAQARGKYLLFLDCDDYFEPTLCEEIYRKAQKERAQVVLFATRRIDMQTKEFQDMNWVLRTKQLPKSGVFSAREISDRIFQITTNSPWSKLFLRDYIVKRHLKFQNLRYSNDACFIRCAIALADRITVLNRQLVTYRFNMGHSTQSLKHLYPFEFFKAFLAVKLRLESEGVFERYRDSYEKWVRTESLFTYRTMRSPEAKEAILRMLLDDGFSILGVTGCTEEEMRSQTKTD